MLNVASVGKTCSCSFVRHTIQRLERVKIQKIISESWKNSTPTSSRRRETALVWRFVWSCSMDVCNSPKRCHLDLWSLFFGLRKKSYAKYFKTGSLIQSKNMNNVRVGKLWREATYVPTDRQTYKTDIFTYSKSVHKNVWTLYNKHTNTYRYNSYIQWVSKESVNEM